MTAKNGTIGRHRLGARFARCLRGFLRDRRGTYAIEFGLLALPFFGLVCGFMEVAFVSFTSEELQAAMSRAARQVMTGQAQLQTIATPQSFVSRLLCPTDGTRVLPSFMDCSKLILDVRLASNFASADMSNTFYRDAQHKYCLGRPGDIVVARIVYPLDAIFPLSTYNQYIGLNNDVPSAPGWKHILLSGVVFKTEPYVGNYNYPATC